MARQYSDDERAAILARSFELLSRDVTDVGRPENSESEMDSEQFLREELARPTERRNTRIRREYDEEKARKMETMAQLEARLNAKIAAETDRAFKSVAEVFARFCGPYEERLAELQDRIDNMRGRDGVSVTAAGINLNGELTLTLSDGTVLTPGVVVGREELKRARAEATPIDVPNVLEARRWR